MVALGARQFEGSYAPSASRELRGVNRKSLPVRSKKLDLSRMFVRGGLGCCASWKARPGKKCHHAVSPRFLVIFDIGEGKCEPVLDQKLKENTEKCTF